MDNIDTYISVLHDSLQKKLEVVRNILELTKEQNSILSSESVNVDRFDDIISVKSEKINEMLELDKGFDFIYKKIGTVLKENKQLYKPQILEMQNYIRVITDTGIELESLERTNKIKFQEFISGERKEIRNFNVSNKTANSYYRNMSNQHQNGQSYFMDKKN